NLSEIWGQILRKVPGLLARLLEKGGIPAIIAPNHLVLRFPVEYNVAKEHCQEPSRSALVETALRELTGQSWVLRLEGATDSPSALNASTSDGAGRSRGDQGDSQSPSSTTVAVPRRVAREQAEKLPLVKKAIDVLGASLQRVDEGFGSMP